MNKNDAFVAALEPAILNLLLKFVFEPNDEITRTAIRGHLHNHLTSLTQRSIITDFFVICDETNNSPSVIDSGILQADIGVKPTQVAEFIYIPIKVVPPSVSIPDCKVEAYDRAMKGL